MVVGRWKLRQWDLYVEVVGSKNCSRGISTQLNIILHSVANLFFFASLLQAVPTEVSDHLSGRARVVVVVCRIPCCAALERFFFWTSLLMWRSHTWHEYSRM